MATEIKKFGICPICEKGQIVEGTVGYSCNYFKSMEDKCTFTIYNQYFGTDITENIVKQLIEEGESEVLEFISKEGTHFKASLQVSNDNGIGYIKPNFKKEKLQNHCPVCDGEVEETKNGYVCENFHPQEENACKLYIPKVICKKNIGVDNVEILLQGEKTPFISGFKNKNDEEFQARLYLDDDLRIKFNSDICECPKCGGNIYEGEKAYGCSNYRNDEIQCDFVIWKEISGKHISIDNAIKLCESGSTNVLKFKNKKGETFERKLILTEDFKVKMI